MSGEWIGKGWQGQQAWMTSMEWWGWGWVGPCHKDRHRCHDDAAATYHRRELPQVSFLLRQTRVLKMILVAVPASDSYPRFSCFSAILRERSLAGRRCHCSRGQREGGGSCCDAERQQVAALDRWQVGEGGTGW